MAATKRKARSAKKPSKKVQKKGKAKSQKRGSKKAPLRLVRPMPITNINKPYTQSQLLGIISANTGLQRKEVNAVLNELRTIIGAHLKKPGPGLFKLPGLIKIVVTRKPATPARKGTNPFTGEEMVFKAKPARNVVKVRPLKQLKELVA